MPSPGRSAGTESEIPWIPRCSDVVELGWGVGQWLGSQILGGVDIVNIKIYPFSQTLDSTLEKVNFYFVHFKGTVTCSWA